MDEGHLPAPFEVDITKRLKGLYPRIYDFENLVGAYKDARRCKRFRNEVLAFTDDLEANLITIQNELIWRTYRVGRYREFFVYEPKKRLIMALPFRDRVVQWAIYRVLNPSLDRRYITGSYACRVGKGAHAAVDCLQRWLRSLAATHPKVYALNLDVAKYFYRIDHDVLMEILGRIIADKDLLWLLETIIRSEETRFGISLDNTSLADERLLGLGMPIGNLTSQMFANLYLNELDQYAKHVLRARHYVRYMDDVVILHPEKSVLWQYKQQIEDYLARHLHLQLNNKTAVRNAEQGVEFCGYRVWPTHRKLRKKTALHMRRRLRNVRDAYARGKISVDRARASVQSYMGLLRHCSSYGLRKALFATLVLRRNATDRG